MKIISQGNEAVTAVCGKQNNTEGRNMRPSAYVITYENEDGRLLYNTITGELLLLEEGEGTEDACIREHLIDNWFYVPVDFDECRYTEQIRNVVELLTPKSDALTSFTIFTTTDCNARCRYCYELGARRLHMSDDIAHDAASFIIRSCGGNRVSLHWFGGEPLYNSRVIDIVVADLLAAGVKYDSGMISNAYLFDDEMVRKAAEFWQLQMVQVTLDGTEPIYNRTKNYIYEDNNAYSKVLGNIRKLLEAGISVHVRLNLSSANYDDLLNLTDELHCHFGGMTGLHVYTALLYDYIGTGHGFEDLATAFKHQDELNDRLLHLGLTSPRCLKEEYRINQCMASNDQGVTILSDGHLGKCEHFIDDGFIGNIYDGITDSAQVTAWKQRKPPEDLCADCPAYPQCNVLIKRCPSNQRACTPDYRDRFIKLLQEKMQNTYTKWHQMGTG